LFIAEFTPEWELFASSSATRRVAARLIPEVASITAKENTDIINSMSPMPEKPILPEIYTVKLTLIVLRNNEVTDSINELTRKSFILFIYFDDHSFQTCTFNKYMLKIFREYKLYYILIDK